MQALCEAEQPSLSIYQMDLMIARLTSFDANAAQHPPFRDFFCEQAMDRPWMVCRIKAPPNGLVADILPRQTRSGTRRRRQRTSDECRQSRSLSLLTKTKLSNSCRPCRASQDSGLAADR